MNVVTFQNPARRFRAWGLLILFFISLGSPKTQSHQNSHQAATSARTARTMFGVKLQPQSQRLLDEVEKHFGTRVMEELFDNSDPMRLGEALLQEDGTPLIRINNLLGRHEYVIVHELFHLKLRAEGFPTITYELPKEFIEDNQRYLTGMGANLRDPILHSVFYPKMREMGLNPDAYLRDDVERKLLRWDILRNAAKGNAQKWDAISASAANRITYYCRVALEIKDPSYLKRLEAAYKLNEWIDELTKAQEMVRFIQTRDVSKPRESISTYIACLNLQVDGKVKFAISHYENEIKGKHIGSVAVVRFAQ
jgi:hypothetical protein